MRAETFSSGRISPIRTLLAFLLGGFLGLAANGAAGAAALWPVLHLSEVGLGGVQILDRNGELLYEFASAGGGFRAPVLLEDVSPHLIHATIATEDADFYENPGINFRGLSRAIYENLAFWEHGGVLRGTGGSSITQQVVKILQGRGGVSHRDPVLKLGEMAGALSLTRLHSKDEILGWYLNSVFYGSASYGAEAASQRYFGKPARDLTLAEASFLAGIPNAPGLYDASENFDAVKGRQWKVLELMAKQEYINLEEAEAAWDVPLALHSQTYRMRAPHFVAYVRELLPRLVGETPATGGIKVATTLDPRLQAQAEDIVDRHVSSLRRSVGQPDAALVALDPRSGEVLAMVGGRWYDTNDPAGQVNNALALNQPGSAMKPITYLAAFEHGWAPATIVPDEPLQLNDGVRNYTLRNFDGKYSRRVSAREALGNSLNVPAVHALFHVGLHTVHDLAGRMGLTTLRPVSFYGPAFTLGGADVRLLDLVYAYGVLANGGEQKGMPSIEEPPVVRRPLDPSPILRVEDSSGNVVWKYEPQGEQVASEQHAYLVTHVLSDDNARTRTFGRNSLLNLPGRPAAAKTGLSEKPHDAWTIGYTPQLVAGVWVGHKNNAPMPGASSTAVASPIWHRFMVAALANQPVVPFRRPEGIQEMEVCRGTGAPPARGRCADLVRELFVAGQVPQVPIEVFVAEARRQLAAMDRGWARANDRQVIEKVRSDPTLFVDDPIGRAIRGQ